MRVGIGHDTHRLERDRPLWLGGVKIEHTHGLVGHSDADVVLHALTDALLGAAALGDIGDLYPDSDPLFRNRESSFFVVDTLERLKQSGWRIVNVDIIIFAQKPKLGPQKERIRERVAQLLSTAPENISVKAKTGESVGPVGREEAISCQAVVLIDRG
ncbi:MAG: 2-C-methyl-D-erythritol 2,4-cyclodiphosphate synthase [Gemmatales bacterium]|nr:MAG: 2-C-methyl-D-erythritol 2,4-cyclodiphosphate synthase [Gemmatales bacterium]